MGTMDVISIDDSRDNDSSLFIIDESPSPGLIGGMTNRRTSQRRKRRSNAKKRNLSKKKRTNLDFTVPSGNWFVLGPHSNDSLQTVSESRTSSSKTGSHSTESRWISQSNNRISITTENRKNHDHETVIILSDEDDSDVNIVESIELSDEEVGVIGGELSSTVVRAQNHLSAFQRQGTRITKAWPKSPPKKKYPLTSVSSSSLSKSADSPHKLRPIVIDGSNVAFGHGSRLTFSSKGLEICCDYFLTRGHTVKVFVPQFRRRHHATSDTHILDKLERDKILIFTPSRKVEGKHVVSYDDRYIVEYATKCGGVIVSRDNFQDLISENQEWKETINRRLLMYTWVDDMIMFPQDPLGRNGPTLEEFLSFPPEKSKGK